MNTLSTIVHVTGHIHNIQFNKRINIIDYVVDYVLRLPCDMKGWWMPR